MKKIISISFVVFFLTTQLSCKKDQPLDPVNPVPNNPEELITTLQLIFTDSANPSSVSTFVFKDPDGDGGNAPTQFDTLQLSANKTYFVSILLLDESVSPTDTISNEVAEEANDHQFFFHYNGVNVAMTYLDADTNTPPLPVGLSTQWKTGLAGTGTSQIILKHQPGTKNGNEANGETDVDLLFSTVIN
jgi:hypothetical protein